MEKPAGIFLLVLLLNYCQGECAPVKTVSEQNEQNAGLFVKKQSAASILLSNKVSAKLLMEPPAVNVKGTETTDNKKKKTLFEDLKQNSNDDNNDGIPLRLKDINLEIHSADSLSQIEIDDDLRNSRHLPGVHIVANNIFNQHTNVGPFILKDNNFPEKGKGTYRKTRTHIPAISEISYNPEVKESTTAEGIQDKKIAEIGHLRNYTAIATAGIIGWLLAIVLLVERIISLCVKKKQGRGISDSTISRKDETTKIKFAEVEAKENQILKSTELLPSTEPDRRGSSPIYP